MSSPQTISIVVFSGDFGRIHYALSMAAAALATNISVTLMFTMGAIRAVSTDASGNPQWKNLTHEDTSTEGSVQDEINQRLGIAGFEELLQACRSMGVKFLVCEMGLKSIGIETEQLRKDISFAPGGLVTFLNSADTEGTILFI